MLKGKTALITGATGGLGQAIARELAKHGCNLLLTGRDPAKLQLLSREIAIEAHFSSTLKIEAQAVDLSIDKDIGSLLSQAKAMGVNILVNSAGSFPLKNILESSNEDFDKCFAVNVRAPFILSREIAADMRAGGWGRIVNIGSSSSYNGSADTGVYCASKHALLGLTRSLYKELRKSNVRAYSVSPGSIKTPMGATDIRQDYTTFLNPEEIAEYISFIISYDKEMISEEIRMNRMVVR